MTIKRQRGSRPSVFPRRCALQRAQIGELAAKPEVADQVDCAIEGLHGDADWQL